MSILDYNQITPKKYIVHEGEPWEVIDSVVSRKQQNKPVNKTKIKNLINGRVIDHTFHVSDKVKVADVSRREIQYIYTDHKRGGIWFTDPENPKNRFELSETIVGSEIAYIKEKSALDAKIFTDKDGEEQIIGIKYPIKVDLAVTEAPPNIKGDSATGGNKIVTVETGATVDAPLFINVGDIISVNTESGSYAGRSEKA